MFSTAGAAISAIGSGAGTVAPMTAEYNNTILHRHRGRRSNANIRRQVADAYIANIRGVTVGNCGWHPSVWSIPDGQLGTSNSSRRFKEDIKPMDQTSGTILALKPVTFHYKDGDSKKAENTPQFGLIAEEVS